MNVKELLENAESLVGQTVEVEGVFDWYKAVLIDSLDETITIPFSQSHDQLVDAFFELIWDGIEAMNQFKLKMSVSAQVQRLTNREFVLNNIDRILMDVEFPLFRQIKFCRYEVNVITGSFYHRYKGEFNSKNRLAITKATFVFQDNIKGEVLQLRKPYFLEDLTDKAISVSGNWCGQSNRALIIQNNHRCHLNCYVDRFQWQELNLLITPWKGNCSRFPYDFEFIGMLTGESKLDENDNPFFMMEVHAFEVRNYVYH